MRAVRRLLDVGYWHLADMVIAFSDVRFRGHEPDMAQCPLMTQSGHRQPNPSMLDRVWSRGASETALFG